MDASSRPRQQSSRLSLPAWTWLLTSSVLVIAILAYSSMNLSFVPKTPISRFRALLSRQSLTRNTSSGPMANITSIQVQRQEDYEQLYPLILEYVRQPERAALVKSFSFRVEDKIRYRCFLGSEDNGDWEAREKARDVSSETAMQKAIEPLALSTADERRDWIRTLTWMRPDFVAERKAVTERHMYTSKYAEPDTAFAKHASALLLLLCPNIERFVYEDNHYLTDPVFETLHRNNYGQLPRRHLQKLREVRILPTNKLILNDERFYTAMNFLGTWRMFHRLPAIGKVSVDAIHPDDGGDDVPNFPVATANFTELHIGHSHFPSDMIAAMIRAPKKLEQFTFTTGGRSLLGGGHYIVYPKTIGKALACQKATLSKLDLDLDERLNFPTKYRPEDEDGPGEEGFGEEELLDQLEAFEELDKQEMKSPLHPSELPNDRPYGATIGSLHDFHALTHLSIGVQLLLGPRLEMKMFLAPLVGAPFRLIDALPASLECLRLRGYTKGEDEHFDSQVEEFTRLKAERLPNLKVVEGIDDCIPSAKSVEDPDHNGDLLWVPPKGERHPMYDHDEDGEL